MTTINVGEGSGEAPWRKKREKLCRMSCTVRYGAGRQKKFIGEARDARWAAENLSALIILGALDPLGNSTLQSAVSLNVIRLANFLMDGIGPIPADKVKVSQAKRVRLFYLNPNPMQSTEIRISHFHARCQMS